MPKLRADKVVYKTKLHKTDLLNDSINNNNKIIV